DELLTTTRSVRRRLDLTRPVPRELVEECVEIATQAPTGSNRQDYGFVCISEPDRKRAIAELYGRGFDAYAAAPGPAYAEGDVRGGAASRVRSSSQYLRDHLAEVPWLVIPVIHRRLREGAGTAEQAGLYGSILPAFWSFMLAARARGLGTVLTTLHLPFEREAAEVLGIPFGEVTQVGMTPLGYYRGQGFRPAARIPLDGVVHWERW
ncbi:MAG: nitroreductase family protein, partial [Candidatus Dormibacteraeota bacterium]|nr:nitroreductase family protein [Candidatus Dormibacteraeota bacterium]